MFISSETLLGIAVASSVGFIVNVLMNMFQSSQPKHPFFMTFQGTKAPLWSWMFSAFLSGIVYTSLYSCAWYTSNSEVRMEWLVGTDTRHLSSPVGRDLQFFKYFLYTFCGYLARDLPLCINNPLFVAHHFACAAGIISTLETTSPGAIAAVHGILVLELGSFFFNVWGIDDLLRHFPQHFPFWPHFIKESWLCNAYYFMLTFSNIISSWFLWRSSMASFESGYMTFGLFSALSGAPLIYLRQVEVNKAMTGIKPKPRMHEKDL